VQRVVTDEQTPALQIGRLLETLDEHGVKYVLVGGVAGVAHGATRVTTDIDICPAWDRENLSRLSAALTAMGAHERGTGLGPDLHGLHAMEISNWRTAYGDIDVLRGIPATSQYESAQYRTLADDAAVVEIGERTVLVASLAAIIRSKEIADRPKDHEALPELRQLADTSTERGPTPAAQSPIARPATGYQPPSLGPGPNLGR